VTGAGDFGLVEVGGVDEAVELRNDSVVWKRRIGKDSGFVSSSRLIRCGIRMKLCGFGDRSRRKLHHQPIFGFETKWLGINDVWITTVFVSMNYKSYECIHIADELHKGFLTLESKPTLELMVHASEESRC